MDNEPKPPAKRLLVKLTIPAERNTKQPQAKPPPTRRSMTRLFQRQQQERFRFLDLPAELRNCVYELTFKGITTKFRSKYPAPGILLANKQIYNGAITLFYHCTTFYFDWRYEGKYWYSRLPSKLRNAISNMRYDAAGDIRRAGGFYNLQSDSLQRLAAVYYKGFKRMVEERGAPVPEGVLKLKIVLRSEEVVWTDKPAEVIKMDAAA